MYNMINSINLLLSYFQSKKSGIEKKLSSSRDQENAGGKDIVDRVEHRDGNASANLGRNVSNLNPWKEQRKKSVQRPKETVQLSLFNRFSFWEDENVDESEVDDGSDYLDHSFCENGCNGLTTDKMVEENTDILKKDEKKLKNRQLKVNIKQLFQKEIVNRKVTMCLLYSTSLKMQK